VGGYVVRATPGWAFKASGRENEGRLDFLVAEVGYATGPPLHVHVSQQDSFYVLEGVLTVQLGDDVFELSPGDFASAPPGVPHAFTNAGATQGACRMVNLLTPGNGFDGYIDQIERVAHDPDALDKLNEQYGVQLVGATLAERLNLS
jgi:quercetin dioxygenase-like cupin family protein